jgi:hypothetical protein
LSAGLPSYAELLALARAVAATPPNHGGRVGRQTRVERQLTAIHLVRAYDDYYQPQLPALDGGR